MIRLFVSKENMPGTIGTSAVHAVFPNVRAQSIERVLNVLHDVEQTIRYSAKFAHPPFDQRLFCEALQAPGDEALTAKIQRIVRDIRDHAVDGVPIGDTFHRYEYDDTVVPLCVDADVLDEHLHADAASTREYVDFAWLPIGDRGERELYAAQFVDESAAKRDAAPMQQYADVFLSTGRCSLTQEVHNSRGESSFEELSGRVLQSLSIALVGFKLQPAVENHPVEFLCTSGLLTCSAVTIKSLSCDSRARIRVGPEQLFLNVAKAKLDLEPIVYSLFDSTTNAVKESGTINARAAKFSLSLEFDLCGTPSGKFCAAVTKSHVWISDWSIRFSNRRARNFIITILGPILRRFAESQLQKILLGTHFL
jgi:hypothetical protein